MAKLPKFKTDQEAAAFWDSHSLTDYDDDLERADEVSFQHKKLMSLRLDAKDFEAIEALAKDVGVGTSTLVRIWLKEKLTLLHPAVKPSSPKRSRSQSTGRHAHRK